MKESLDEVANGVAVRVAAPSRLHFGLLRFAEEQGMSYGGLGVMIDRPCVDVRVTPDDRWSSRGLHRERALKFAKMAAQLLPPGAPASFAIQVDSAPEEHIGLGTGTQLALAVAAGVFRASGLPLPSSERLARCVGRGKRSAVGTHGFYLGGLIHDGGYEPGESLGRLAARVPLPSRWRFLVIRLPCAPGTSGIAEQRAFDQLPPPSRATTEQLERLAVDRIIPAVERGNLRSFAAALYEYGMLAGGCFAPVQGGPFACREVADAVQRLKSIGVTGVGQTSWGPTVFAVLESEVEAEVLRATCHADPRWNGAEFTVAAANNAGAAADVGWA